MNFLRTHKHRIINLLLGATLLAALLVAPAIYPGGVKEARAVDAETILLTAVNPALGPIAALWGDDGNAATCGIYCHAKRILIMVISAIQITLLTFIGILADWIMMMLAYGTKMLSFPAVTEGFKICLSITNLLFVTGLIIGAFQMILGIQEGEAKKRLGQTILYGLLINFSMLIAGFLLDISNVLTVFFSASVTSDNIRNALSPTIFQTFGEQDPSITMALAGLAFTIFVVIILIAVFGTALVRNLHVAVLLLLMPLSWGFLVFPGMHEYGKKWWDEFIKWGLVVLPTMTFFLYLAIQAVHGIYAASNPGKPLTIIDSIVNVFIVAGIMVAGLKISQSVGGFTAKAVLGGAASVAMGAATYTGAKKFLTPRLQSLSGKASEGMTSMAAKGGVQGFLGKSLVMAGVAGAGAKFAHGREHDLEESAKARYGDMGKSQLMNLAKSTKNEDELAKIFMILKGKKDGFKDLAIKDGKIDPTGAEALKRMSSAYHNTTHNDAKDVNEVKEALSANPLLALQVVGAKEISDPKTGIRRMQTEREVVEEWTAKIPPSKMGEVSADSFKDPNFGSVIVQKIASSPSQIRGLANNASEATINTFRTQVFSNINASLLEAGAKTTNASGEDLTQLSDKLRDINKQISDAKASGLSGSRLDSMLAPLAATRQQIIADRNSIIAGAGANAGEIRALANGVENLNQVIDGRTTI